jgi:hypothetical protein
MQRYQSDHVTDSTDHCNDCCKTEENMMLEKRKYHFRYIENRDEPACNTIEYSLKDVIKILGLKKN